MSPEQARGDQEVDTRSDVYSLGVMLYEILTGKPPLDVQDRPVAEALRIIQEELPVNPSRLNPRIKRELAGIIVRALFKERDKRYRTAGDLADDLDGLLRGEPISVGRNSAFYVLQKRIVNVGKRNASRLALAAAVVLLLSAALAVFLVLGEGARRRERQWSDLRAVAEELMREPSSGRRELALEKLRAAAGIRLDAEVRGAAVAVLGLWDSEAVPLEGVPLEGRSRFSAWSASLTAEGRFLATATARGPVVWSIPSGKMLTPRENWALTVQEAGGEGSAVAFRPDGKLLAVAGQSNIQLWEFDGATVSRARAIPADHVTYLTFSPSTEILAAAAGDPETLWHSVQLWRLEDAEAKALLAMNEARSVSFSQDGAKVAFGFLEGGVRVYEVAALPGGKPVTLRSGQRDASVVTWHPDGMTIAVGSSDGSVRVQDTENRTSYGPWSAQGFGVQGLAFAPEGEWLASCGWTGGANLLDPTSGERLLGLDSRGAQNYALALSSARDGRYIACAGENGQAVCEVLRPEGQWTRKASTTWIEKEVFDRQGTRVATLSHSCEIAVWEKATGRNLVALRAPLSRFPDNSSLAFSPSGKRLAWVNFEGAVKAWEWTIPGKHFEWDLNTQGTWALSPRLRFLDEEKLLVARHECIGPPDGPWVLRAYDLAWGSSEAPLRFEWSLPGKRVFYSGEITEGLLYPWLGPRLPPGERRLRLHDLRTGEELQAMALEGLEGLEETAGPHFSSSRDGTLLLVSEYTTGQHPRKKLLQVTREGFDSLREWTRAGGGLASPDGNWNVVNGRREGELELWDLVEGRELVRLRAGPGACNPAAFSPDGNSLAIGTTQGVIRCFNLPEIREALRKQGLGW